MADVAQVLYCGICGAPNPKENNFCTKCGTSLLLAATPPVVALTQLGSEISSSPAKGQSAATHVKKRGGCLTTVMIGLVVFGISELAVLILRPVPNGPDHELAVILILGTGIAYVLSGIGLWRWKKWGFSVFVIAIVAQSIGIVLLGPSWLMALSPLVLIYIMYRLLQPIWQFLEQS